VPARGDAQELRVGRGDAPRSAYRLRQVMFPYLLVLPSLLMIVGLTLYPTLNTIYLSLFRASALLPKRIFLGVGNYVHMVSDPMFLYSLEITVYYVLVSLVVTTVGGIAVALLLHQKFVGRGFVRAVILLPWAIPEIVNGMMWKWIFDADYGALNGLLEQLGLITNYIHWLGQPFLALNMVILADAWKQTPLAIIIILATLQTIPAEVYEAARIDGAGAVTAFTRITLPLLRTTLLVVLSLRTIFAFRAFGIIYVLTGGGPADGTKVLGYHIYQQTFEFMQFGYGAALSIALTVIVALIVFGYLKILNRPVQY
jgi:ABC-type sugar transport system permease subunit